MRAGSVGNSVGTSWTRIGGALKQIDSGPYGIVCGVNRGDDIYCRIGITDHNPKGTGWHHIGGKLKYISCGELGCWGVNSVNQIFFRTGVSRHNPAGVFGFVCKSFLIDFKLKLNKIRVQNDGFDVLDDVCLFPDQ